MEEIFAITIMNTIYRADAERIAEKIRVSVSDAFWFSSCGVCPVGGSVDVILAVAAETELEATRRALYAVGNLI